MLCALTIKGSASNASGFFTDVPQDSYYFDAVKWAVEKGVTNGTSATTFSPNQPCTYAHVVTFLWRLEYPLESNPGGETWYAIPAAWSDAHGLLTGTNFVPNQPCPRSDIVTYLYRNSIEISMSKQEGEYMESAVISAHSDKWENGAIRYTNGFCGYRDGEFESGQTGTVRLSGNTLFWMIDDNDFITSDEMDYIK